MASTDEPSSEYGGDGVIACAIVFMVFCTLFVSLSTFDSILLSSANNEDVAVKQGGVGRHEQFVLKYMPEAMVHWTQALLVTQCIYGLIFPLEKTSILLLYLGLFRVHRWLRVTVYVMMAYIWMWGISILLVAIFQCTPVASQWDKTIDGTCINQLAFYRWLGIPNAIHDVSMLIVPAPAIWKLQMPRKQKIALTGVFLLGSIGCIASFIRVTLFFEVDAFSDNTWVSIQLMSWALAEPGIILICVCIPSIWPLVARYIPGAHPRRGKTSKGTSGSGGVVSEQSGGIEVWDGQSYGINQGGSNFIRLNDIEDQMAGYELNSSDRGAITVTNEFVWREELKGPNARGVAQAGDDRSASPQQMPSQERDSNF
ncbi:putative Integral membrane protein [Seiridium unicorne]|uniref:Integral membrane protein n=1 Tax=Seiridium unicorne TaxID=138068 RepID=A0ABR2V687_9PEZI